MSDDVSAGSDPAALLERALERFEVVTVVLEDTGAGLPAAGAILHHIGIKGNALLERFRLVELIGAGGMGRVYKATDSAPAAEYAAAQFIAVKVLGRPFDPDPDSFAKLRDDVHRLRRLNHPHIVRYFAIERDGPLVFMTMEYLPGESLQARLTAGAPASHEARHIVTAIATALDFAHRHTIVHGDLKPGNVIVNQSGAVKVIDFSMASLTARPKGGHSGGARAAAVTPRYASPQMMARHRPQAADDVYALACLAYEMVTGIHPFDDGSGALNAKFPPPLRVGLTLSEYAAIVQGLRPDELTRTPTIRQFIEEFGGPPPRKHSTDGVVWGVAAALAAVLLVILWFRGHPFPRRAPAAPPTAAATDRPATPTQTPTQTPTPPPAQTPAAPPPAAQPAAAAGTVIRDCPTCPLLIVLPAGHFTQGSATDEAGSSPYERPRHDVVIAYPLAVSANDLTVGEFNEFIVATGRDMQGCDVYDGEWRRQATASWENPGFSQSARHPVTCASWLDATAYAEWISARTSQRYRLPSAAEWEYAARGGGESVQPWSVSGADACLNANVADRSAERRFPGWRTFACDDGYVFTAPVGSFRGNALGLNDLLGNVFQWTQDCWHADYTGAPADGSARMDGDCAEHELRGGSWFSSPLVVRISYRNHFAADYRTSSVGFRLVRELRP